MMFLLTDVLAHAGSCLEDLTSVLQVPLSVDGTSDDAEYFVFETVRKLPRDEVFGMPKSSHVVFRAHSVPEERRRIPTDWFDRFRKLHRADGREMAESINVVYPTYLTYLTYPTYPY
jgi:hypothetical protein